jgi:hypothetical protein
VQVQGQVRGRGESPFGLGEGQVPGEQGLAEGVQPRVGVGVQVYAVVPVVDGQREVLHPAHHGVGPLPVPQGYDRLLVQHQDVDLDGVILGARNREDQVAELIALLPDLEVVRQLALVADQGQLLLWDCHVPVIRKCEGSYVLLRGLVSVNVAF